MSAQRKYWSVTRCLLSQKMHYRRSSLMLTSQNSCSRVQNNLLKSSSWFLCLLSWPSHLNRHLPHHQTGVYLFRDSLRRLQMNDTLVHLMSACHHRKERRNIERRLLSISVSLCDVGIADIPERDRDRESERVRESERDRTLFIK